MKMIYEGYLHNITGCQNIMLPVDFLFLSAEYNQNGFKFYYQADNGKELPTSEINLYVLVEGDIIHDNSEYLTSIFDKKLLQAVHIYQLKKSL